MKSKTELLGNSIAILFFLVTLPRPYSNLPAHAQSGVGIRFVKPGVNGNCESWGTACDLQEGLEGAVSGTEIWVAEGTYTPGTDRLDSFKLKSGVNLYGGFTGTEVSREQRDPVKHITVLSGDLWHNDGQNFSNNGDNAYHVVSSSIAGANVTLDGFTIAAGNANGTVPHNAGGGLISEGCCLKLTDVTIRQNYAMNGGGVFADSSSLILENVTIMGNYALNNGGGVKIFNSSPLFINVVFFKNSAINGGGIFIESSNPILTETTFFNNTVSNDGGGVFILSGSPIYILNSIVWGNVPSQIVGDPTSVKYSDIQDGWNGVGNIDSDPKFVDPANGNLQLSLGSHAIDASSQELGNCARTDRNGLIRPIDGDGDGVAVCDMGAYEFNLQRLFLPAIFR